MQDCVHEAFDQLKPAPPLSDQTFILPPSPTPPQRSVSWGEETHSAVSLMPSSGQPAGTTDPTKNVSTDLPMPSDQVYAPSSPLDLVPPSHANDTLKRKWPIPVRRKLRCHCTQSTFYDPSKPVKQKGKPTYSAAA